MSADAEMVPVAWLMTCTANPEIAYAQFPPYLPPPEGFTETPLYSADTIAALRKDTAMLEWIWANCRIIYFPGNGAYPLEHTLLAGKDSREDIERAAIDAAQSTEGER